MPPQKETTHRNQNQETQTAAQPAQMPKAHGIGYTRRPVKVYAGPWVRKILRKATAFPRHTKDPRRRLCILRTGVRFARKAG